MGANKNRLLVNSLKRDGYELRIADGLILSSLIIS